MKNDYNKLLNLINYPTIYRLYELENHELTDFVIRGIKYIIENKLNLRALDSDYKTYAQKYTGNNNCLVEYNVVFEYIKEKPITLLSETKDTVTIAVIEQQINVSTSKVLYLELNKEFLKQYEFNYV